MYHEAYQLSPKAAATAAVLGLWVAGLVLLGTLDLWLGFSGRPTVSDRVWAGEWWLGVAVIAWCLVGPAFLTGHFWLGWLRP